MNKFLKEKRKDRETEFLSNAKKKRMTFDVRNDTLRIER